MATTRITLRTAAAYLITPADGPVWLPRFAQSIAGYLDKLLNAGTLTRGLVSTTTAYTVTADDFTILADATGAAFTVTLPKAADNPGQIFVVKRMNAGANAVTVDGNGAETIDGALTSSLAAQYASVMLQSTGAAWVKI